MATLKEILQANIKNRADYEAAKRLQVDKLSFPEGNATEVKPEKVERVLERLAEMKEKLKQNV